MTIDPFNRRSMLERQLGTRQEREEQAKNRPTDINGKYYPAQLPKGGSLGADSRGMMQCRLDRRGK